MIKAFLFDYDGVMTAGVKDGTLSYRLSQNLDIDEILASQLIEGVWQDFSAGRISEAEVWHMIEKKYGQPISPNKRDIWYRWSELRPLPEMTELVRSLKTAGYTVGVLSNVLPVTADLIRAHGGYDGFDFTVLSYLAGARKPDPKVYEIALSHLPDVQPAEVVFLDDRESCVAAAEKSGIHAIHVTDHERAIEQVQSLLSPT